MRQSNSVGMKGWIKIKSDVLKNCVNDFCSSFRSSNFTTPCENALSGFFNTHGNWIGGSSLSIFLLTMVQGVIIDGWALTRRD